MKKYIFLIIILCLYNSCKENIDDITEGIEKRDFTLVKAEPIEVTNDPIAVYAIGRVSSDKEVKLSFKIGGIISSIKAEEGEYVKKGKLLATIRTNEIDAQVLKAERAYKKAQRDLERVQNMYNDKAATLENVQDLTTLLEVTRADLEVAQFNQQYAKIISPISGRILRRNAEPNELVSPGMPIFVITNSSGSNYVMKAALSDKDVNRINYGDKAIMSFDAYPADEFKGSIEQISESADPRTGTFEVDISINKTSKRLRNGNIGRVEIYPKSSETYYRVPMDAIVETKNNDVIIFSPLVGDTIAKEWQTQPVHIDENFVLVNFLEGDAPHEVITAGAPYLMDGDKIKIENRSKLSQQATFTSRDHDQLGKINGECIIVLGAYAINGNVDKMIRRLQKAGYEPFTRPFRSLTQVGITISCDPKVSRKHLSLMRSNFASDAVLLNSNDQ